MRAIEIVYALPFIFFRDASRPWSSDVHFVLIFVANRRR